ncbi:uncharacterized protein LOC144743424 [Ciona intestinalis]
MLVVEAEEAIRTIDQLNTLIKDKFQTTPNEIKAFADTIRGEGRDMEAILFFEIADDFMKPGSHGRVTSLKPAPRDIFASGEILLINGYNYSRVGQDGVFMGLYLIF